MRRSYRKFDHQSIHDAANDGDEVKGIPRVFEVTLHCHSYVVRQGSSTVYLRREEKVNKELVRILHNGSKKSANLNVKDAKKSIWKCFQNIVWDKRTRLNEWGSCAETDNIWKGLKIYKRQFCLTSIQKIALSSLIEGSPAHFS